MTLSAGNAAPSCSRLSGAMCTDEGASGFTIFGCVVTIITHIGDANPAAAVRPNPQRRDRLRFRTLVSQCGGRRTAPAYDSPSTTVRTSNPRLSWTSHHRFRCVRPRIAPLRRTRSRPEFESNPCSLHPVLDLCAAARSAVRSVPAVAVCGRRPHRQGTPLVVFR